MKGHIKSLVGSAFAFVMGTSCCWLSALAVWLGGAAFLGSVAVFVEGIQMYVLLLAGLLLVISLILFLRNRRIKREALRKRRAELMEEVPDQH